MGDLESQQRRKIFSSNCNVLSNGRRRRGVFGSNYCGIRVLPFLEGVAFSPGSLLFVRILRSRTVAVVVVSEALIGI